MSKATMKAIEDAIRAHIADEDERDDKPVLNTWVLGFATGHIFTMEDVDGVERMFPSTVNDYLSSSDDPNAAVGLAHWLSRKLEHDGQPVCDLHLSCEHDEEDDE